MNREEIEAWLREEREEKLEELWSFADEVRRHSVGDKVYLRALLEISNYCRRACAYCGLRAANGRIDRYRASKDEIMAALRSASAKGYGTVVIQAGEDEELSRGFIADLLAEIKRASDLAVTLSLGERSIGDMLAWRLAGADRYFLRFETSNSKLFEQLHPPWPGIDLSRLELLEAARRLGYESGSGIIVGLPGQTYGDLVNDLETFARDDFDMIGVGPYIENPDTPPLYSKETAKEQVPASVSMCLKVVALTRMLCPEANIPSTTALSCIDGFSGHKRALCCGANVMMVNFTAKEQRELYQIYPGKSSTDTVEEADARARELIASLDREPGMERGDSRRYLRRKRACGLGGSI